MPIRYRATLGKAWRTLQHLGTGVTCPCCGWRFRRFLPGGIAVKRANALCPRCGSLERHRLLWLYLKSRTDIFQRHHRLLHFAPEAVFAKRFRGMSQLVYITADLSSRRAGTRADIMNIPYKDNSFDIVLCNHVLEHVEDDQKAMREICRVLSPHGWAILQTPIDSRRSTTFEDPAIVSPEAREQAFGQRNHVRMYGRDYKERLKKAGFTVNVDSYFEELGPDLARKYGLQDEEIYFCTKRFPTATRTTFSLSRPLTSLTDG